MENLTCGSCLKSKPQGPGHPWYAVCQDCIKRIAELEAELAVVRDQARLDCEQYEAELAEYRGAEHIYGKYFAERAEKVEAELDKTRAELGHQWGLAKAAEAEVERLKAENAEFLRVGKKLYPQYVPLDVFLKEIQGDGRGVNTSGEPLGGVSSSLPLPDCAVCGLSLAEHTLTPNGNQAWREGHWFQKAAARKERDESLLSQKPRENGVSPSPPHNHPPENVCDPRYCLAARKERDDG